MIEVELRGKLTKKAYQASFDALSKDAQPESYTKNSIFFQFPNGILKVSAKDNGTAILSLKSGDEITGNLDEIDVNFEGLSFHDMVRIIEALGYTIKTRVEQKRTDFRLPNNMTISLKYTEDWGLHFEADTTINDSKSIEKAKTSLQTVCTKYGLKPMSESELRTFLATIA